MGQQQEQKVNRPDAQTPTDAIDSNSSAITANGSHFVHGGCWVDKKRGIGNEQIIIIYDISSNFVLRIIRLNQIDAKVSERTHMFHS